MKKQISEEERIPAKFHSRLKKKKKKLYEIEYREIVIRNGNRSTTEWKRFYSKYKSERDRDNAIRELNKHSMKFSEVEYKFEYRAKD